MNREFYKERARQIKYISLREQIAYIEAQKFYKNLRETGQLEAYMVDFKAKEITNGDVAEVLCPDCNVKMDLKQGKHGPFYGCPRYPECKVTRSIGSDIADIPVDPEQLKESQRRLDLAVKYITDVGGAVKADKYLSLAKRLLE